MLGVCLRGLAAHGLGCITVTFREVMTTPGKAQVLASHATPSVVGKGIKAPFHCGGQCGAVPSSLPQVVTSTHFSSTQRKSSLASVL